MPEPSAPVIDDFNRTNQGPPPSSSWAGPIVTGQSGLRVVSNELVASATGFRDAYWNEVFPADQEAAITFVTVPAGQFYLHARINTPGSAHNSYFARYTPAGSSSDLRIGRVLGGSYATLATYANQQAQAGDRVSIQCEGTSPTTLRLYRYRSGSWSLIGETTDSSSALQAGGMVGVECNFVGASNVPRLDDLRAGPLITAEPATVSVTAGPTPARISAVAGRDESAFTFEVDGPVDEWELRAVSSGGDPRDEGDPLVLSGGAVAESEEQVVTYADLDAAGIAGADGPKMLKVYALNDGGWSS